MFTPVFTRCRRSSDLAAASANWFTGGSAAGPCGWRSRPYLSETAPEPGRFTSVAVCLRRSPHQGPPSDMNRPARVPFSSCS